MADAKMCVCGHGMDVHYPRTGGCTAGVPITCLCKAFIAPISNVDTTATRAAALLGELDMTSTARDPERAKQLAKETHERISERLKAHDPVLSPAYYRRFPNGVEPRHIAGHLTFHLGTALAYVARAGFKGDAAEDILKAIEHLRFELERLGAKK